ncbi:methylcrotonoyl-CoA carboxylase, partial [Microbispora triticiradicis]
MSTSDWPVLESRCDPGGEAYKRDAEANERLVAELRDRLAAAARGGPERARARHA